MMPINALRLKGFAGIDSHWTQRKLLLHFDGTNGATTTTDSCATPHTIVFNGNTNISTAQAQFGVSSMLFDGTGDYLGIADSSDWQADAFDWSAQLFARFTANPASYSGDFGIHLIGQGQATVSTRAFNLFVFGSSLASCTVQGELVSSATRYQAIATGVNLALNTWHYFALVRDGNTLRLGLNGSQIATADVTGISMNNSGASLLIGAFEDATFRYYHFGYIDEVRFTKGFAESVTVVPTVAFPDS